MSNESRLQWQWPAERVPSARVLVEVESVKEVGKGIFGIGRSASIAANLPDPIDLHALVVSGPPRWASQSLVVRMPRAELGAVERGQRVVLGLLGDGVCICAQRAPEGLTDADAPTWLANWKCGGPAGG